MRDLIIVGAGPAGLYAAYLAGLKNIDACLIESADLYGGQLQFVYPEKFIYDLPGISSIPAKTFIENLYKQYQTYQDKVPLYLDQKAISVIKDEQGFTVKTGVCEYQAKRILITHGGGTFEPRKLEYDFESIYYFMQPISKIENQDIVILGGGDSAIDYALMIQDYAKTVTIIHRRDDFRANPGSLEKLKKHVKKFTSYQLEDLNDHEIFICKNEHKEVLNYHKLFVFYGSVKGKSRLSIQNDEIKDALLVNSKMQSIYEGVYASGNACTYDGKVLIIATALGEVATAITNIADDLYPMRNNHQFSSLQKR